MYCDWSHYESGRAHLVPGGLGFVEDGVRLNCHGGSHLDARGHVIAEGTLALGIDAATTVGGLSRLDVAQVARTGVVCRAVLCDLTLASHGAPLERAHEVTLSDIESCLVREGAEIEPGDMLLLHTGSLRRYRLEGRARFFHDYSEPGVSDDRALIDWIDEKDILGLGSDTLANELPRSPRTREEYPMHRHLLRDRGLQFHETLWLEDLALDCARDGVYAGLYVASPLKIVGGSGSPVNPLFVK